MSYKNDSITTLYPSRCRSLESIYSDVIHELRSYSYSSRKRIIDYSWLSIVKPMWNDTDLNYKIRRDMALEYSDFLELHLFKIKENEKIINIINELKALKLDLYEFGLSVSIKTNYLKSLRGIINEFSDDINTIVDNNIGIPFSSDYIQKGSILINKGHVSIVIKSSSNINDTIIAHAVEISSKGQGVITTKLQKGEWFVFEPNDKSLMLDASKVAECISQREPVGSIPFSPNRRDSMMASYFKRNRKYGTSYNDWDLRLLTMQNEFKLDTKAIDRSLKYAARYINELKIVHPDKIKERDTCRNISSMTDSVSKYGVTCVDFAVLCYHIPRLTDLVKKNHNTEWISRKSTCNNLYKYIKDDIDYESIDLTDGLSINSRNTSPAELLFSLVKDKSWDCKGVLKINKKRQFESFSQATDKEVLSELEIKAPASPITSLFFDTTLNSDIKSIETSLL